MKKSIRTIILIIIFLGILIISNNAFAATADLTVDDSDKVINIGDTVTVTIKVNAAQWDVSVNASGLSYVSGTQRFTELDNAEGNLSKSATVKYKADKAGEFNISLSGDVTDISGENLDVSETIKLTVKAEEKPEEKPPVEQEKPSTPSTPETPSIQETPTEQPKEKSSDAYLSTLGVRIKADLAKELGVETNEYDFSGFSKKKTTYNVTIPSNVDYLKVEYKTADSNATVKVTGNSEFEVGSDNKIKVKVTAEDGKTTKTYTIKVTKLAEEEEKPGNVIEDEEGIYLTSLGIDGINLSPEFDKDTYSYTATLSDSNLTEINVTATANKSDANIEISGNTNLVVGENTINIVVKQEGSVAQTVYQITLIKEAIELVTAPDATSEDSNLMDEIMGSINKYVIIAVAVVVLMIVLVIVLIVLLRKENKRLKEENIDEVKKEYDVYKNDENEFEDNKVQDAEIEKTNETETKNERKRTKRKEKGRHSK